MSYLNLMQQKPAPNLFDFAGNTDKPQQNELQKLATLLDKHTSQDGFFDLAVGGLAKSGLHISKYSKISDISTHTLAAPGICIVAQGAKSVSLAHQQFEYDESCLVVYAAEVPISMKISRGSKEAPYLCLVIDIDPQKLAELVGKVFPNGVPKVTDTQAIYLGESNNRIVQSAIRLMEIINEQQDCDLLVPLMLEEILIRLLRGANGAAIAQIGVNDSNMQRVGQAISWLKENFDTTITVEKLAQIANMSTSSFHRSFKQITTISPLQFQKKLRLQKARNLITTQHLDITQASYAVGYSSASQFSREYSREFGVSPSKDIAKVTG